MRTVDRQGVHIEQCENCRGIFLDHGELEQMLTAENRFYGAAPYVPPGGHRSCFAVFVDQVPAAAQAARTARVSCGVACSGHGLRNLAAMMTRRSLMAMSS